MENWSNRSVLLNTTRFAFCNRGTFLLSYLSRSISHYCIMMDGPFPVYLCVQCRPFMIWTASMMDGPDLQLSPINIGMEFASLVLDTLLSRTYRITRATTVIADRHH